MSIWSRVAACALVALAAPAAAQDYTLRLDVRAQSVWFRGLTLDSVHVTEVVAGADGGPQTAEGHAVRCGAGEYCFFFRPGPALHGFPMTTTASATVWGFGVRGLSLRATGRLLTDVGRDDVWPGTEPATQLVEGYLEYERSVLRARGGRQLVVSRLEPVGFDGAWLAARWDRASLEVTGYGGWGLGQATAVPVTDPALNPLDEFQPRDRQIVAGASAAWRFRELDFGAEYRREVDPEDNAFVSERAAVSMVGQLAAWRLAGGLDYNIAEARLGSGDLTLTWLQQRFSLSAGVRRYRPYFSLWTLWGAFSPVPYNAVNASAQLRPYDWLSLYARGERYRYEDAEISTALVPQLVDRGWRARLGGTATIDTQWVVDVNAGVEHGPGASSEFVDAAVSYIPNERFAFDVYGGTLARPLELRFYDATSRWIGGRVQWQLGQRRRFWTDVAYVGDDRDRPDASASSLAQFRFRAGMSLTFGTGADRSWLPPARPTAQ